MRGTALVLFIILFIACVNQAEAQKDRGRFRRGGRGNGEGPLKGMHDLPPECREKLRALQQEMRRRREEIMAECRAKTGEGHKDGDAAGGGTGGEASPATPAPAASPSPSPEASPK